MSYNKFTEHYESLYTSYRENQKSLRDIYSKQLQDLLSKELPEFSNICSSNFNLTKQAIREFKQESKSFLALKPIHDYEVYEWLIEDNVEDPANGKVPIIS